MYQKSKVPMHIFKNLWNFQASVHFPKGTSSLSTSDLLSLRSTGLEGKGKVGLDEELNTYKGLGEL